MAKPSENALAAPVAACIREAVDLDADTIHKLQTTLDGIRDAIRNRD